MLTRFKNLSRKKKTAFLVVVTILLIIPSSFYIYTSSEAHKRIVLEEALTEKGVSFMTNYHGPNILRQLAQNSSVPYFEDILHHAMRPYTDVDGFYICRAKFEDELWEQIAEREYGVVQIEYTNISIDQFENILKLKNLYFLTISESDFSDQHFTLLKKYNPNLSVLDLHGSKITDQSIAGIHSNFDGNLKNLNLSNTLITDQSVPEISKCNNLIFLNLSNNKITDQGIRLLSTNSNIEYLSLQKTLLTDKSLEHISRINKLELLNLEGTNITDKGLKHLTSLSSLKRLYLSDTTISDKSIPHLIKMQSLRDLIIVETKISTDGVKELKSKMPNCTFAY